VLTPTKREGVGAGAPLEARFEPRAGSIVDGKYVVERVLGEGGMGVVVAATHLGLEQRVAIKFLAPEAMRSKEAVERFQREAKVAAKVRSEHVARVHDVGTVGEGGVPYIVMEYLEGRDLGQLIDQDGKLPIDDACEIAIQACEALAEVHVAGIVHRDLKPSNLFITRRADGSPCVKLLDFGISKFTVHPDDSAVDPALTATATIMGSPSYMSPEQLKSTKEVDARTDVWSLGAVLYEAVTGKPAFRAETVPQVCAMIASDEPAPPSNLRANMPAELEAAILACLDKKPEKRASLVDFARVLARHAPERARASLERIEAVATPSTPDQRPRAPSLLVRAESPPPRGSRPQSLPEAREPSELPVLAAFGTERARTQSSWGDERRGRRGGGGALMFLLMVVAAVFGIGMYTGTFKVSALRGRVANATSAVASAVESALPVPAAPSASHHPSATASSKPAAPPPVASSAAPEPSASATASAQPEASASGSAAPAGSSDEEEDEDEEPIPVASAIASAIAPYLAPYIAPAPGQSAPPPPPHGSAAPKKHNPKHHKSWKKHH